MSGFLVVQTDFGQEDGAVNAMYGVAYGVDRDLLVSDLTHEIEQYDIHDASYRLLQSVPYWAEGTVFVSVVDPGVGTKRRSVAARLKDGQYVITPDNGTLTYLARYIGIEEVRQIDQTKQRLAGSSKSHTFHGRDVYMYNGARLASGRIQFEELGKVVENESVVMFPVLEPTKSKDVITGTIDILDVRFGSLWSNIPSSFLQEWRIQYGDRLLVRIYEKNVLRYEKAVVYGRSFAQVAPQEPVLYSNSLLNIGLGLNLDSFAKTYSIRSGIDWTIELTQNT